MKDGRCSDVFRFKHFSVANIRSAQRIGTDGVITGATAPSTDGCASNIVWDAGAGTGLIALMAAQRFPKIEVVAIELEHLAAQECRANVAHSPWSTRMKVVEGDVNVLAHTLPKPALIVSNPPFFASGKATATSRRDLARHDGSLSPATLIDMAARHLAPYGMLHFIAPHDRNDEILLYAELARMTAVALTDVASRSDRDTIRRIWTMMRRLEAPESNVIHRRIDIHSAEDPGQYSDAYKSLTSEFYLDF